MDNRTRAREWLEHNGLTRDRSQWARDRDREALTALLDSVRREERLKVAEEVEYCVKRLQVSARYAGDVGRILREVRALAPSPPPDDKTKEDGRR